MRVRRCMAQSNRRWRITYNTRGESARYRMCTCREIEHYLPSACDSMAGDSVILVCVVYVDL